MKNITTTNRSIYLHTLTISGRGNFFKNFDGHMSFYGVTDTPVLDFWLRFLWVTNDVRSLADEI